MTPFQHFRQWTRQAPVGERVLAALAAVCVVSLAVWAVVPATHEDNRTVGTFDTNGQATAPAANGPTALGTASDAPTVPAVASDGVTGQAGRQAGPATAGVAAVASPACPSGSGAGVSSTELKLAVIEVKAVGPVGESAFGVPSTDEQQQYVQDVIDSLNAAGGVGCRKLVAQFFTPDSVDQSSLQQTCLDVQQSGAFAVVDLGAYTAFAQIASCYPREGLAYFTSTPVSKRLVAQYYPLYFSSAGMNDVLIRNGVFAFKQRGQIDPAHGFKKLGVFYRSCVPDYWNTARDSLHQNGVSDADIVTYDMGCASAVFAPPSDVQQAVLKFRQAGVTHVMPIDENPDLGNFTHVAQSQGFKPRYLIANEDIVATVNSATANVDKQNFDGALSIDLASYPERTTPGVEPSAGTAKCNAIYAAKGKPPVYEQGVGMGGHVCTLLWMFAAAAGHATTISRASLADGLHTAKSADWSFPEGPNDYSASRATTGGQFWRPGQYSVDCDCWRLLDVNWHPSFP